MEKTISYYTERERVAKKYADEIKEEIEGHLPRDFWTEEDIESSIECILDQMYKEINPPQNDLGK